MHIKDMKLISKDEYLLLRAEMSEFVTLCNENNYIPEKSDFEEIIEFVLESEDEMCNLFESYESNSSFLVDSIYESFTLNEVKFKGDVEYDNKKDFDAAVKGVGVAAGLGVAGVVGVGMWIKYLFRKRKVKKMIAKQNDMNIEKLKSYSNISSMKIKLAELEGNEPGSIEWPSYT